MAEIGALLRRYTVNNRIEGSNPSVSAKIEFVEVLERPLNPRFFARNAGFLFQDVQRGFLTSGEIGGIFRPTYPQAGLEIPPSRIGDTPKWP